MILQWAPTCKSLKALSVLDPKPERILLLYHSSILDAMLSDDMLFECNIASQVASVNCVSSVMPCSTSNCIEVMFALPS